MTYAVVCLAAVFASALTLVSGFGLGTLLLPVLALFFPLPVAVAGTAIVHLANNLFKLGLVGRHADRGVAWLFVPPAIVGAFGGALVLGALGRGGVVGTYALWGTERAITPMGLVMGVVIGAMAALELTGRGERASIPRRWVPVGGVVSGFLGGLSGHQGALRSAFLVRAGLTRDGFVATGVVASVAVDVTRLGVYGISGMGGAWERLGPQWPLVASACVSAFAGAVIGARVLRKMTLTGVRRVVGASLLVFALAMSAGMLPSS